MLRYVFTLVPSLTDTEFRVLAYLGTVTDFQDMTASASSREIAAHARMSRSAVQTAIDGLIRRRHLTVARAASTTSAPVYVVQVFKVSFINDLGAGRVTSPSPGGGPSDGPPMPGGGLPDGPPMGTYPQGAGPTDGPPRAGRGGLSPAGETLFEMAPELLLESRSRDRGIDILEGVLKAKPKDFPSEQLDEVRRLLHYYEQKLGDPRRHPPTPEECAPLLALAPFPQIREVVQALLMERRRPGEKYAWWLAVLADRVHGVRWSSKDYQSAHARLRVAGGRGVAGLQRLG